MKYSKNNEGFFLAGAAAWIVGIAALVGGGVYVVNESFENKNTENIMKNNVDTGLVEKMDHSFVPNYDDLVGIPMGEISEIERAGLISMREEEKLARDVYRTLYEKWGLNIFQNISYSENRHSLAVKELLDRYDISDPVLDDTTGVFTLPEMQKLYNNLVEQGKISLVEALKVGATIEDLDIYDLNSWIKNTDNADIEMVYESLIRGSRNHMRSFAKQLSSSGATYTAQFLEQSEIDEILDGEQEKGDHEGLNTEQGFGTNGSGQKGGKTKGGQGFNRS